jgi:putative radical SAM enzyme (TIGR03279 family)
VRKSPGGLISRVQPGSLGQRLGLGPGDHLLKINGQPLRDIIDVQFYAADEELELLVERDGRLRTVATERSYDVDLGLEFTRATFDVDVRRCANNCEFCFVKQNPPGMRSSLSVKDDDYRYSFLYGSFVTLTNLREADWQRLEEQRLSPLYVSVHATEPGLRSRILGRTTAPDILEQLRRLERLGIEVHTQVVLVPGINDGEHLDQTIADLAGLYRCPVASLSVVPIGLTRYHEGKCRPYTPAEARALLDQVEPWRRKQRAADGCMFVYPSDEWYLLAGSEVPPSGDYDGFPQVENGVGMVRLLVDEWEACRRTRTDWCLRPATLACGTLIAPVLAGILEELHTLTDVHLRLVPVANQFFGPVTTVSGLLTGQDVVDALRGEVLGEVVLLPRAMFVGTHGAGSVPPGTTLDGMTVAQISAQLGSGVEMVDTLGEALAVLQRGHAG